MIPAGGAKGGPRPDAFTNVPWNIFELELSGPDHFRDVSGRGGQGHGQVPPKRWAGTFLFESKTKGARQNKDFLAGGGQSQMPSKS